MDSTVLSLWPGVEAGAAIPSLPNHLLILLSCLLPFPKYWNPRCYILVYWVGLVPKFPKRISRQALRFLEPVDPGGFSDSGGLSIKTTQE